jgi:hypothetical protein
VRRGLLGASGAERLCALGAIGRGRSAPQLHHQRRSRVFRTLLRLYILRVAIGLSAGLIGGCVELPGIYYNVLFDERPSESDCVNLTDALTTELNLRLQPSIYQCAVTLDNHGYTPSRNVVIFAYFRQQRILVEIEELRSGSPTVPSPSTQQFAQQVVQIVQRRFPTAQLVRVREIVGPIGR